MRTARFEVYSTKSIKPLKRPRGLAVAHLATEWRWRLIAANGRIIATGEAHTRERDAWRAVRTVAKAAQEAL